MSEGSLLEAAIGCHSEGRLRDAEALYDEFLKDHPQHPDALHLRGVALFQLNDTANAELLIREAISFRNDEADYHSNLGLVLEGLGQHHEAMESYKTALVLQPDYRDALINLARLEVRLKLTAEAVSTFRCVVGENASDTSLIRDFVAALIENKELAEAERVCRRALDVEPGNAELLVSLGHVQQSMKLPDDAFKTYSAALILDPVCVRATNNLGTIYMNRGDTQLALEWFLKAIALDKNFVEASFNAGVACQETGNLQAAIDFFNAAISLRAYLPRAYRYLSEIYRVKGKSGLHQETLRAWLDSDPDSATAKHLLAASMGDDDVVRASDDFIREEFDDFADSFNERLEKLQYTTPAKLVGVLGRQGIDAGRVDRALDAGCGTGLCGDGIAKFATSVVGVDLSGKMLQQASTLDVYEELVEDELVAFMHSRPSTFDLVVSADTLVYFGALESVVEGARTTLKPGGRFAFSVELMADPVSNEYRLQDSGRYCHAESYVESCLSGAGFGVSEKEITPIRMGADKPVIGLLIVATLEPTDSV